MVIRAIEKKRKCSAIVVRPCGDVRGEIFDYFDKDRGVIIIRRENRVYAEPSCGLVEEIPIRFLDFETSFKKGCDFGNVGEFWVVRTNEFMEMG